MRDLIFMALMALLLMMALARPFVGLLVYSWVSFMSAHRLSWGIASGQSWAMYSFAATVVGMLVAREPKRLQVTLIMVLLVVFAACITATTLVAISPDAVVWRQWDRVFKVIIGLLLTGLLLTERWRIHAMIWLIVISLGYFGVRGGMFTLMTGGAFRVLGPPDSMIGDRNHLAVALLVAIPLMNWLRMHSRHAVIRWGLIAAMVLTLFSVVGSQSRGALIALAAVGLLLWLRSPGKILSGIAIAAAIAAAVTFMPQSWVDRMNTIQSYQEDASAMGRVRIWTAAFDLAKARPLTGGGFRAVYHQHIVDQYSPGIRARATHSIYFEVMADHGFVVFGLWVVMILVGVWYTFRLVALARNRPSLAWASDLARMSQVSIVAYLVGGAFLSLSYWDVFWTLIVILGATHALVQRAIADGTAPVVAPAPGIFSAGGREAWGRPATARGAA
jgi:putative inorganic carbon (hco3(-)) transporter